MWHSKIMLCSLIGCFPFCSQAFKVSLESDPAKRPKPFSNASTAIQQPILSPPHFHPLLSDGHSERVFRFGQHIWNEAKPKVPKSRFMVDSHSQRAALRKASQHDVSISDSWIACLLLAIGMGIGYVFYEYSQFINVDDVFAQPDNQEKDVEAGFQSKEVFSPSATSMSTATSMTSAEQGTACKRDDGAQKKLAGLPPTGRLPPSGNSLMGRWPPTASKSSSFSKWSPLQSISESAQMTAQLSMSSESESTCSWLPPVLSPDFAELCNDGTFFWTISAQQCHAFVQGSSIEVHGSPSLYARLATHEKGAKRIEIGTTKDFIAAEGIVRPLKPSMAAGAEAELIGPDGTVYGYFLRKSDASFAVTTTSRDSNIISLKPVTTSKGSFLEIDAEGNPVCLAKIHDAQGTGVEIDLDPDVDALLIVSCVLASLFAAPELLPAVSNPSA